MQKASDLLVKALENEGVKYVFGIPGEENLDILESLRNSSIELVLTRHEQGAGFMAATYGRLTGKMGVCLATLGPGATNFVTCASYAYLGGMPVLFITGQKPIKASKQGKFQIIDVVRMMEPITKFTRQIVNANQVPSLIREVFRVAEAEKPGPVHLELPEDVAAEETARAIFPVHPIEPVGAGTQALEKAIAMIKAAKRPLVMVASGANRGNVADSLSQFIDRSQLYFASTQMGKGVLDERHERYLGTTALSADDYVHCAINRADLIINIGHDVTEKPPFFMEEGGCQVVHVSHFSAQIDDVYFPQHEVLGSLEVNLSALAEHLSPSEQWDFDYFDRVKKDIEGHVRDKESDSSFPLIPQRIVAGVRKVMPDNGIITLDNGMYKIWFARNYPAYQPNTVLLDNALATMGAGLPSAMAAKLLHPDRKVMAICGDGGFMMNSQEIETAIRMGLNLVVMILRDDAYGMIRWKQHGGEFADFGLQFGNPDFVTYAEAYGAKGWRIESAEQFESVLTQAIESDGVHLVDVPIDYSENTSVFFEELKQKTCLL